MYKRFSDITPKDISSRGVQSLADRPNHDVPYGVGGLSPAQLKAWFDQLSTFLAEKINDIQEALSSGEAAEYIHLPEDGVWGSEASLADLLSSFASGEFANNVLCLSPSAAATEQQTLQTIISGIAQAIAEHSEGIENIEKSYIASISPILEENGVLWLYLYDANQELLGTKKVDLRVDTKRILDGVVTESKIGDNAVTAPKIKENSVTSEKIATNAVTTEKIAPKNVKTDKIADYAITKEKIYPFSIFEEHISNGSVTRDKIADGNVLQRHLSAGCVTKEKLSSAVSEKLDKAFTSVRYDAETGVLTFTAAEGSTDIDLPLELIVSDKSYFDDTEGAEAAVLVLANGGEIRIPINSMTSRIVGEIAALKTSAENAQSLAEDARAAAEDAQGLAEVAREAVETAKDDVREMIASTSSANALKGTASGASVFLDDVSSVEHEMGVTVKKKNLLTNNYAPTSGNANMTVDGATITLEYTGTGNPPSIVWELGDYKDFVGKTYTVSFDLVAMSSAGDTNLSASFQLHYGNVTKELIETVATVRYDPTNVGQSLKLTFKVPEREEYGKQLCIRHYMVDGRTEGDYIALSNIQLEEGTEVTAYVPYIEDLSTVMVVECGKNLLDAANTPYFDNVRDKKANPGSAFDSERTETGIKFTAARDGVCSSSRGGYRICPIETVRGKTVTLSFKRTGVPATKEVYCIVYGADTEINGDYTYISSSMANTKQYGSVRFDALTNGYGKLSFNVPSNEERKFLYVSFYVAYGATLVTGDVFEYSDIQVEISDTATKYERSINIEHAVDTDGAVSGIVGKGAPITLYTDTAGALIECKYNRDINKAFAELQAAIISLGGNV